MRATRSPRLHRLAAVETRRLVGGRLYAALTLLAALAPLLVAAALRGPVQQLIHQLHIPQRLLANAWLAFLGSDRALEPLLAGNPLAALGLSAAGATGYAWIIASILAATAVAGDMSEGRLPLAAARPVTRGRILAAKLLAVEASLAALYLASAASSYLAATLIFGSQSRPWLAPVYAAVLAAAQTPLVLATMAVAFKTGRTGASALTGVGLYLAGAMASSAPLIAAVRALHTEGARALIEAMKQAVILGAAEPLHGATGLTRAVLDAAIAGASAHPLVALPTGAHVALPITYSDVIRAAAASIAAASAALYAATLHLLNRQTL